MKLFEFTNLIEDQNKLEEYLIEKKILRKFEKCIHCGSHLISKVRRGNIKCYSCKKEWLSKKLSILENIRVNPSEFLYVVICFSYKFTIDECIAETGLKRIVVSKLYDIIREAISPINIVGGVGVKKFSLFLVYESINQQLNFSDKLNHNEKRISLRFKRIKRVDSSYTYSLHDFEINENYSIKDSNKIYSFVREIESRLNNINNRSTTESLLNIGEILFRWNNKDDNIVDAIVKKIGRYARVAEISSLELSV